MLVAEGWCPARASATIREALFASNRASSAQMGTVFQPLATKEQPPTHFTTNKITEVFQGIVEAYGVGRYREVNPAVFTIVTFPFLFAVMFGDFGHGVLMLLAAVYMVAKEKELKKIKFNQLLIDTEATFMREAASKGKGALRHSNTMQASGPADDLADDQQDGQADPKAKGQDE